jgi:hypothetical protein
MINRKIALWMTGLMLTSASLQGQVIITGYTFPKDHIQEFTPDQGLDTNHNFCLSYVIDTSLTQGLILVYPGSSSNMDDHAAGAVNWYQGANMKYWKIDFYRGIYKDLTLSSQQKADTLNPGPKHFKIQYGLKTDSTMEWKDIMPDTITCTDSWSGSGQLVNMPLPDTCNNWDSIISIRWIMVSNLNVFNEPVTTGSVSLIDNIFIKGVDPAGDEVIFFHSGLKIYPNPVRDNARIVGDRRIERISLYNPEGSGLFTKVVGATQTVVDLGGFTPGMYLIEILYEDRTVEVRKIAVIRDSGE